MSYFLSAPVRGFRYERNQDSTLACFGFDRNISLKTHANKCTQILTRAITWADTTLSVPRTSVVDRIHQAEAAHLIGYLKNLDQRGSDFGKLGDKLLQLAVDRNEEGEVRSRCVQALGRINYTKSWTRLKAMEAESLSDQELVDQLNDAIATLRQSVQERCN